MGILSRFKDIMASNINALLDKAEDPGKMVDQYLLNMRNDLASVKTETANIIAEEKRAKRVVDELTEKTANQESLAKKALTAGNEGDARVFLAKKQEYATQLADASNVLSVAKSNTDKMRQLHDKLAADIRALEARRDTIKAKASVAKAQETVNKAGSVHSNSGVATKLSDLEGRVDKRLDAALAVSELNEEPVDEAAALAKKYEGGASVDDELARLKTELGV
ncbi:phage shock protein A [Clostridia bacterium]|nr:phage shock protein A [Clostridia bacterium]